jgi:hypothetical protein
MLAALPNLCRNFNKKIVAAYEVCGVACKLVRATQMLCVGLIMSARQDMEGKECHKMVRT